MREKQRADPRQWFAAYGVIALGVFLLFQTVRSHQTTLLTLLGSALLVAGGASHLVWLRRPRNPDLHEAWIRKVKESGKADHFTAVCDCGWESDVQGTAAEALSEASEHTPRVRSEIEELNEDEYG